MSKLLLLAIIAGLLTGCVSPQAVDPVATPQVIRVEVSSALDWLRPGMAECALQAAGLSLLVDTVPFPRQGLTDTDINLRWSNQTVSDGFAFELGEDMLALIVHPDNPIEAIEANLIKDLYAGQKTVWSDTGDTPGAAVQPWVFPAEDETQKLFETGLLANGQIVQTAKIAPTPAAMLEAVAKDPQAIGFLPTRWLNPSVKPIEILDFQNNDLLLPILAVTKSEPTGLTRDWLLCLQEQINP